jgi:heme/copper-type cytochrome/quinol oxidase subunit 1
MGLNHLVSTGYLIMLAGGVLLIGNIFYTLISKKPHRAPDAWGVNDIQQTFEWMTTSPPAPHNFDRTPKVA